MFIMFGSATQEMLRNKNLKEFVIFGVSRRVSSFAISAANGRGTNIAS